MREKRAGVVIFEEVDLTQEQFDQPIFWLLAALLFFMPAALGCWDPASESIAQAGACGLAILLAFKLTRRADVPFVWSWTYLPIAVFILFGLFQLIPLPAAWIGAISPKTLATNHALLDDLPSAAERLRYLHINFYSEEAWHDLRKIIAVALIFVVVVNVFRRAEQMTRILWLIAIVGTAEGLLSIAQNLTGARAFYWLIPIAWGDVSGGSFPNHNCFSQFMNLCSGAMIGLLLLKIDQTFRRRDYSAAEMLEKFGSEDFRPAWILLVMLAISISSVFLSLSRGGMISIVAGGIVVSILLMLRGGARGMGVGGWFAGVMLVAVFAIIMAGGKNLVEGRIARIGNREDRYDRLQLTKDALRAWKDYPAVGMGLGGFPFTFPSYDRSNVSALASHAEDEYVELLQETGVVGAAIAGAFVVMIFVCFLQTRPRARKSRSEDHERESDPEDDQPAEAAPEATPRSSHRHRSGRHHHHGKKTAASPASSLALGLCFGLVAILVQSATDFGQHSIGIASFTAVSCALMVNLARLRRRERGLESEPALVRGWVVARGAALLALVVVAVLPLLQANAVRTGTAAFENENSVAMQLSAQGWKSEPGQVTEMNRFADESVQSRPDNILYHYWRDVNRWYTISDVIDPSTGDVIYNDEKLKTLTALADDLQNSRWLCPLYGPLYCQLGQWERNSLGHPEEGARNIRMAFQLSPGDPVSCYIMALLDAEEGRWADSITHFQRSAQLQTSRWQDAVNLYIHYFHRPDMAVKLAGDDVEELRQVAATIRAFGKDPALGPTTGPATQPADEALASQAEQRAADLVRAAADQPDAPPSTMAERGLLCFKERDFPAAIKYLGKALKYDYGEVDWRLAYAQSYAEIGNKDEAMRQARIILRERPQMSEAQDLIDLLNRPTTQALDGLLR